MVEQTIDKTLKLFFFVHCEKAQILGNNESFEPYTSNIYNRRVLSGEFQVVNHHLIKDLTEIGMWDDDMKNEIIADYGSIQNITRIPQEIRKFTKCIASFYVLILL